MKPEALAGFLPLNERFEGKVPWMYLDVLGLVTTAIGNLIDTPDEALSLPWLRPDGSPATRREIAAEWATIKAGGCRDYRDPLKCAWPKERGKCFAHAGHKSVEHVARLRLNADGIATVVNRTRDRMAAKLAARFPDFDSWPWQAQLATMSVSWACGPAFRFPKLEAALRAQDFEAAAQECTIREAGNPGVKPRNVRNRELYRAAAVQPVRQAAMGVLGPAAIDTARVPHVPQASPSIPQDR